MKHGARNYVSILIVIVLVAGCRTGTEDKPGGSTVTTTDAHLIIYTGRDKDEVAAVLDRFTEKFPQYKNKVDTVILGAQAALDRLRSEKVNPQAGFLWGGTLQGLQQAANENLLAPSNPSNSALIDASRKDPKGRWYAEMLLP